MDILESTAHSLKVKVAANEVIPADTDLFSTVGFARRRLSPVAISNGAFEYSNGDMTVAQDQAAGDWTWTAADLSVPDEVALAERALLYRVTEEAIVLFTSSPK